MTLYITLNGGTSIELPRTAEVGVVQKLAVTQAVPISRVVHEFLEAKRQANLRPEYLRSLKVYLEAFIRWRENTPVTAFNLATLELWFSGRTETPAARRSNIGRLSSLFSYAWRRGFIQENPCRRLERIRVDAKPPRILTPLETRQILHYMNKHGRRRWRLPQVVLGVFCGIRPHELARLYWRDIDLEKGLVRIDASASKVRRRRIVPVPDNALAWLTICKQRAGPIGAVRTKWISDIQRGTGLKWDHDILRHSAASYLLAKHEDAGKVSRWLGNSADVLLRCYAELVSAEDCLAFWSIRP